MCIISFIAKDSSLEECEYARLTHFVSAIIDKNSIILRVVCSGINLNLTSYLEKFSMLVSSKS